MNHARIDNKETLTREIVSWLKIGFVLNFAQLATWTKMKTELIFRHLVKVCLSSMLNPIFLPAMGGISPYMSVRWQQPVEIGLKMLIYTYLSRLTRTGYLENHIKSKINIIDHIPPLHCTALCRWQMPPTELLWARWAPGPQEWKKNWWGQTYLEGIFQPPKLE